ncbi:MAG: GNAT family N-acetyltransferase [Proteobacteria bacterium]|nr:GNAT family N-acetyltransferase [Pseudomonadota bacterium]MBU1061003.1 GNAT family N-acetyltransferase [Pseudomonadota bacterium]
MGNIRIRRARVADLEDMVCLLQQLFSIEEDFDFDAVRQRRGLEMMLDHAGAVILVAEVESQIIGMCSGQSMVSTAEGAFSLLVEDVVVDEWWRGRGVGTELLKALEEWARETKIVRFQLLADRSNKAGLKFYHKQTWQDTKLVCLCKRQPIGKRKEG